MKAGKVRLRTSGWLMLVLMSVLVAVSCKDDDDTEAYFVRFMVDGGLVEYEQPGSLGATFNQLGQQYIGFFTGFDANTNISIQVYDDMPISAGMYTDYTSTGQLFTGALMSYSDEGNILYTQGSGDTDIIVNISEINNDIVRGTFSGTLKAGMQADITVTDGQFFLERAN